MLLRSSFSPNIKERRDYSCAIFDADGEMVAQGRDICAAVSIPVIASGGMGAIEHLLDAVRVGGANVVAMAYVLHYQKLTLTDIRDSALAEGLPVRAL